jgi:hypothetical protein
MPRTRSTRTHTKKKKQPQKLLSHHRHSGRLLHHRHTSYPIVAMMLLVVGVFLALATFRVRAADIVVTAVSNGPLPPGPAVILSPNDGDRFTSIPIPVSGTCPYPYVVKLYRNNTFSGSVQCNPDDTWLLYTDLFAGENELVAKIVNFADQEGPASAPVTVFYDVPDTPTPETPPGETPSPTPTAPRGDGATPAEEIEKPFVLSTDMFFKAVYVGDEIKWEFQIVGGTAPFTVTVAWGDGGTSTLTGLTDRIFTVSHTYQSAPVSREYFPVSVTAADDKGREATLQVFSILNDRITPAIGGAEGSGGSNSKAGAGGIGTTNFGRFFNIAWPAYGVTLLMVISFWLGQRRGFLIWGSRAPKAVQNFHAKHFRGPRRHA